MNRLALVPLDERPVCTSLPASIAACAGVRVELPPARLLPDRRRAGDPDGLGRWLAELGPSADAAVVSLEGLGFGGLIASRIGSESVEDVLDRWRVLNRLALPAHASIVIPRCPDADDADEEPEYWAEYGRALNSLSRALAADTEVARARVAVPEAVRSDWLNRRLRQHTLAFAALGMAGRDHLDTLLVGVDDAEPGSLSALDQQAIRRWAASLELERQVVVHPGTDELGAVLVARALTAGDRVRIAVVCAEPEALGRTARYEPLPVGTTAQSQIEAAGAVLSEVADADAVLVVHPPDGAGDWATAPPVETDRAAARATAALAARQLGSTRFVGVADVAQPNGADPALITALGDELDPLALAGFAAWNTAGNSLGTVVAQLVATVHGHRTGRFDAQAHARMMSRRFAEDWAWMSVARAHVRHQLGSDPSRHDHVEPGHPITVVAEQALTDTLAAGTDLRGWRISRGSFRFPWHRTFEADFEMEHV